MLQRQQDPEAYANHVKTQQQEYRRRTRKPESILNLRKVNRERQR